MQQGAALFHSFHMNYKRPSINIPSILREAVDQRIREAGYWSISAYVLGLIIFDLWCRRPHKLTAPIFILPPKYRDPIFEEAAACYLRGDSAERGTTPGWFEAIIAKEVEREIADREAKAKRKLN